MNIFKELIQYFNQKVRLDVSSITKLNQSDKEQAIANGEAARKVLSSPDFSLQYHLHRFTILDELEDATTDEERIAIGHKVKGMREFLDHLEKQEYFGRLVKGKE